MRKRSAICLALLFCFSASYCATVNMRMGTNFWVIGWGGTTARSGNGWNPAFLDEIKPYGCLRFMDWQGINGSGVVGWASRGAQDGITYEMMVDLCNVNNSDAWFCIPHKADDDFIRQLATLAKKNLKSNLKYYVEYSNEIWNTVGVYVQATNHCADQARAKGIGPAGAGYETLAQYYNAYRMVEIAKISREVFGAEAASRVRAVVGSCASSTNVTTLLVTAFRDPKVNPDKVAIDGFGIAPYFGKDADGSDMKEAMTLAKSVRVGAHLQIINNSYNSYFKCSAKLVAYEGGQHYLSNADVFSRNPGAYDVYKAYLDMVAPFIDVFCHYAHSGSWGSGGAWGAKQFTGQPADQAPKYKALVDWAKEHPYTPVSVGPAAERLTVLPSARVAEPWRTVDLTGRVREALDGSKAAHRPSVQVMPDGNGSWVVRWTAQ